jgi:small subunit ribosomal protein S1
VASKRKSKTELKKKPSTKKAAQTMEQLLDKYGTGAIGLSLGDRVKGKIISIGKGRVIVDIGGKGEGLVAEKAYKEAEKFIKTLKEGDEVETMVLVPETPDGFTILSLRQAAENKAWKRVNEAYEKGEAVVVQGKTAISAGLMVDVFGLAGFIPNSQLGKQVRINKNRLVDEVFKAKLIDVDRGENKVVLSEKEVSESEDLKKQKDALRKVKKDDVYEGKVISIYNFGCFVEIAVSPAKSKKKVPLEGLVHISELSWDKVDNPRNIIKEGDKVKVKVIDTKENKLAFSIKQIEKDPWDDVAKKYEKDKRVKGTVVKTSDFGVFVQLEPGVEGLIHMTKIPPGKKLAEGDKVSVYIEEVDRQARKMSLGLVLTEKPVGYR